MPISPPRMARISGPLGSSFTRSTGGLPFSRCNKIWPSTTLPGGHLTRRMTDMAVTLLPQPLSPTTPKVDWRFNVKLTPLTALTIPFSRKKCVCRFLISKTGGVAPGWLGCEAFTGWSSWVVGLIAPLSVRLLLSSTPRVSQRKTVLTGADWVRYRLPRRFNNTLVTL